jgi:Flp pilus assembly protein TadG
MKNYLVARMRRMIASEDGSPLIEMALILPMLMVFITGMVWIGIGINHYMVLTNAVSAGARAFAISPAVSIGSGPVTDPCTYGINTANSAAPSLQSLGVTYTVTYTVTNTGKSTKYTPGKTVTCSGITTTVGDTVRLDATAPFTIYMYGFAKHNLNILASSTEVMQ